MRASSMIEGRSGGGVRTRRRPGAAAIIPGAPCEGLGRFAAWISVSGSHSDSSLSAMPGWPSAEVCVSRELLAAPSSPLARSRCIDTYTFCAP